MGADGWIDIFDATAIEEANLTRLFFKIFGGCVYKREIFGRKLYTAYYDTNGLTSINDNWNEKLTKEEFEIIVNKMIEDGHSDKEGLLELLENEKWKEPRSLEFFQIDGVFNQFLIDQWEVWT